MNWDAIAAAGSLLGALGVVGSLIYLAMQIRANSEMLKQTLQASRIESSRSVNEGFDRMRSMVLDTDSGDLWVRGLNDLSDLDRSERIRFAMIASSFIWSCSFMYDLQRNEGLYPDVNARIWQDLFLHPGFREWLREHLQFQTNDFGEFLREVAKAVGDRSLEPGEASSLIPGKH